MKTRIGLCKKFQIIKKVFEKSPEMEFAYAQLNPPYQGLISNYHKKLLVELIKELWRPIEEYINFQNSNRNLRKKNYILYSELREMYLKIMKIECKSIISKKAFLNKPSP